MELTQKQLEDVILYHKFLYYEIGNPMIEDKDYDNLHSSLEERFPDSFLLTSPGFPIEYYIQYNTRHNRRLKFADRIKPKEENDVFVFL